MAINELLQMVALLPNPKVLVRLTHLLYTDTNTNASSMKQSEFNAATSNTLIYADVTSRGSGGGTVWD